jgi:uncharacterized metal-binding protein
MTSKGDAEYRGGPGPHLVFCCSGAADVGEIGHRAARLLDDRGVASRFCLAGVGGGVEAHLRKTRQATIVLAIDGCRVGCARRTLERAGFSNFASLCVGDLGIEKGKSPMTEARVQRVFERAQEILHQCKHPSATTGHAAQGGS